MKFRAVSAENPWYYNPARGGEIHVPARLMQGTLPDWLRESMDARTAAGFSWSRIDLYCLLHETGHAAHHHVAVSNPIMRIAQERQAWQYAADCLKESEHPALWAYAAQCMRTYYIETEGGDKK